MHLKNWKLSKLIFFFNKFLLIYIMYSHREEITAERLTPFRVFMIANPREKFTQGEVSQFNQFFSN